MQMEIRLQAWKRQVYQEKEKAGERLTCLPPGNLQPEPGHRYTNMKSAMAEEMLLSLVLRESALLGGTGGLKAEIFSIRAAGTGLRPVKAAP